MESYIIRIYRQEKEAPEKVVGTAERVGDESKKPFKSVDELWEILNAPAPKITGAGRKRKGDDKASI